MLTFLFYFRILIFAIIIFITLGFSFLLFCFNLFLFLHFYYIRFKTVDHFKQYNQFSETPLIHMLVGTTVLFSCVSAAVITACHVYVDHKTFTLLPRVEICGFDHRRLSCSLESISVALITKRSPCSFSCVTAAVITACHVYVDHKTFTFLPRVEIFGFDHKRLPCSLESISVALITKRSPCSFSCVSAAVITACRVYVDHKTFTLLPRVEICGFDHKRLPCSPEARSVSRGHKLCCKLHYCF